MAEPINYVQWANLQTLDPTTSQYNRRTGGLTPEENNYGIIPYGARPSRQGLNTVLYELGKWTEYLKTEFLPVNLYDREYLMAVKNGLFLKAGCMYSNSSSITFEKAKMSVVVVNPSDPSDFFCVPGFGESPETLDNTVAFSAGGLKAYPGTPSDVFLHIFMVARRTAANVLQTTFAADTDDGGTNVIAGMATSGYTHCRKIAILPYINLAGLTFAEFIYAPDDYIMYGEQQTLSSNSMSSSSILTPADQILYLQNPSTMKAAPDDATNMRIRLRGTAAGSGSLKIWSKDTAAGICTPTFHIFCGNGEDHVICDMYTKDSSVQIILSSGAIATVSYTVLGYKNPCVDA